MRAALLLTLLSTGTAVKLVCAASAGTAEKNSRDHEQQQQLPALIMRLRGGRRQQQQQSTIRMAAAAAAQPAKAPARSAGNFLRATGRWYTRLCATRPLVANLGTMGIIALAGDSLMQAIEGGGQPYDAQRTGRFVLFRLAFTAPYYTAWYQLLELAFPTVGGARSLGAVLSKTVLDCVVSTPVQHLVFFSSQAAWEGAGTDAVQRALAVLPRSVPTSWAFWAPIQLVTFGVVPLELRVLFMNSVSVVWNAVLSGLNEQARRQ